MAKKLTAKSSAIAVSETKTLSPIDIRLDPNNPRLSPDEQGNSESDLLAILLKRFKLVELGRSIASSGFIPFDPLVGLRDGKKVYVLEGNRRIAAMKLLLNPELAPESQRDTWTELAAELGEKKKSFEKVTIITYGSRDEVSISSYIGFRHVTSVLKWPALEKAAYIARLVEKQQWTYREIAERLGSYPRHIERHYVAYRIVMQAQDEGIPGCTSMQESFGVLLRALQAGGISEFLGVTYPDEPKKSKNPVPSDRADEFASFVKWTFGDEKNSPVLEDSRQLTRWAKVLQSPPALRYLKTTSSPRFDRAWQKSGGESESLADGLYAASFRLEESVPLIEEHLEEESIQDAVTQCARFMSQILTHFPDIARKHGLGAK
jgi:hypothetical protein